MMEGYIFLVGDYQLTKLDHEKLLTKRLLLRKTVHKNAAQIFAKKYADFSPGIREEHG